MDRRATKRMYLRMAAGGVSGGIITGILGYSWAAWNNNLNPVAGLGLVVLMCIGTAAGMFAAIFKKETHNKEDTGP